jgi:hypothetical protein
MPHSTSYSPMAERAIAEERGPNDDGLTLNTMPLCSQPDVVGS